MQYKYKYKYKCRACMKYKIKWIPMIDSILEEVLSFSSITSSYLCFLLISLRRGLSSLAALSSSSMMDCVSFSLTQFFVFGKHARSCPSQLESIDFFHVCVGTDIQPSTTLSIHLTTKCRPIRIHSFHRFWHPPPRLPNQFRCRTFNFFLN